MYRIVHSESAQATDFLSDRRAGRPLRDPSSEGLRRWEGFSVRDDPERAEAVARRYPQLGRYLAVVEVADAVRLEESRRRGHYTAYGDPQQFLGAVVRVMPVE